MKNSKWIVLVCAMFVLLLGGAWQSVAVPPIASPVFYHGQATITTANCSASGGLCQPAPACNNGAGPNPLPSPGIQATVNICEIGYGINIGTGAVVRGALTASGYGTGFQFGKVYVSLLYRNGNTSTCSRFPAGVPPTLQNIPQADSDFASMMLGFWKVYPDGTATLDVAKEATVSGLWNYQTVSVREIQPPNTSCFNCGLDPAPQLNALRACGPLTVTAGGCSLPDPTPVPTPTP